MICEAPIQWKFICEKRRNGHKNRINKWNTCECKDSCPNPSWGNSALSRYKREVRVLSTINISLIRSFSGIQTKKILKKQEIHQLVAPARPSTQLHPLIANLATIFTRNVSSTTFNKPLIFFIIIEMFHSLNAC